MSAVHYDAMIIGSGPSGSFAAKELTAHGLKVVLIEAGPEIGPKDFNANKKIRQSDINLRQRAKATLTGQSVQSRAVYFDMRMRHLFVNDRENPYTTPRDAPFAWIRSRQAGGRSHVFGRCLLRWTDDDFRSHSRTGKGEDWPVDYNEIVPYYEEVEKNLGIYGRQDNVPTQPDSIYSHEAKLTPAEELFKMDLESKWPERKVISWRYIGPEPTRVLRPLRDAIASGNLDIFYNTIARRVLTDPATGRATGAEVIDTRTGATSTINASAVVLCASPVESIRLMLNSASAKHPAGLGNSSGLLGRYFMDQLPCVATGSFPKAKGAAPADTAPADPFYGPSGGIFVPRFVGENGQAASDFNYQGSIGRYPTNRAGDARLSFFGFGVMQPDFDNRVSLDPKVRDAWGIPAPHIRCKMGETDRATLGREVEILTEMVEGTGGELEYVGSPLGLIEKGPGAYPEANPLSRFLFRKMFTKTMIMGAAIHEAGGARMGSAPDNSVLDQWNRSWDIPNLLVTDASAFPTSGIAGTTLTIMALTVRACRRLASELSAKPGH
ncbi:oxidoreductase [Devosia sp. Root685]|uniref:FAD-dependent oxidoreductase n=1 Tax=Devosia sp. Root685 TaxID=1736587 RepID=UPI0006F54AC6|nr:GMC family oxidoreductase [Devosia sp. Root685]KRA97865.1 oxidoreductase [Devosia sp. Root685]